MLKKLSVLLKNVIDVSFRTLTLNLTKMLKGPALFSFSFSLQQNTFKVGRDDSSWMETFFLKQSCPHNSKYVCFACIVKTPKIELRNRGGSLFPRCSLKMNSSSFRSAPKGYIARFSSNKATFPYVLAHVLSHLIVKKKNIKIVTNTKPLFRHNGCTKIRYGPLEYSYDYKLDSDENAPLVAERQLQSFFSWARDCILDDQYGGPWGTNSKMLLLEMDRKADLRLGPLHIDMYISTDAAYPKTSTF